jgi:kynurenine formamidase
MLPGHEELARFRVLDLSQDWDTDTPGFARYDGPTIKWVKRVAFEGVGGMEITSTLHVGTHLDAPNHFITNARGIGELPLDFLVGPACVVDLQKQGVGDYEIYGPENFERWERDTGQTIERGDILVIHTGYHRFYPSNWTASCGPSQPDETRYFIKHPGPTREFAEWVKARGIRWLALDAGSADHPMNTVIRQVRPDLARKCAAALGRPLEEIWPDDDIQVMHYDLFPHEIIHIENAGGDIDRVLDQRVTVGCFPWRFRRGEAAFCRFVAFLPT